MTLKEMMQAAWKRFDAKLQEQKALIETAKKENRELNEDEEKKFDSIQAELDAAEKEAKRYEKMLESETKANEQATSTLPFPSSHETQKEKDDDHGFKSLGEFIGAVHRGLDERGRLQYKELVGTDGLNNGGFLIPPQFVKDVLTLPAEAPFVRNYATVIPAGGESPDAELVMPAIDYSINMYGGVTVDWVAAEGGDKPETTMKFTTARWLPHEIAGWLPVTDKLLRNSSAVEALIKNSFRNALANFENRAFLFGDGENKPLGVLHSKNTAMVKINRLDANGISYRDLIAMRARMTPENYRNAIWIIDQSEMVSIMTMADDTGRLIYLDGSVSKDGGNMLLGRPALWTNQGAGLSLIDFSAYVIKDGSGPFLATSEHVRFLKNQTVIKIFEYVDGSPWVKSPITHPNGLKTSPFISLDVPFIPVP